jgi:hypothetical protein
MRVAIYAGAPRTAAPLTLAFSTVSAAESFRSTWGAERGTPDMSRQRFPTGAPHVGQGTEDNCLRVSSLIFIRTGCDNRPLEVCSIAHIFS